MASFLGTSEEIPMEFSLAPGSDLAESKVQACHELEVHRTDSGPFVCEAARAWKQSEDVGGETVTSRGFRILGLGSGRFVAFNEAPVRSSVFPVPDFHLERYGQFVVSEVIFPRWKCPSKPDDECVRWHPRIEDPRDFYCGSVADRKCLPAGIEAQLTVLDERTGLMAELGPFNEPARAVLAEQEGILMYSSSECGMISLGVYEENATKPAGSVK
jgi:hypothetical protein